MEKENLVGLLNQDAYLRLFLVKCDAVRYDTETGNICFDSQISNAHRGAIDHFSKKYSEFKESVSYVVALEKKQKDEPGRYISIANIIPPDAVF